MDPLNKHIKSRRLAVCAIITLSYMRGECIMMCKSRCTSRPTYFVYIPFHRHVQATSMACVETSSRRKLPVHQFLPKSSICRLRMVDRSGTVLYFSAGDGPLLYGYSSTRAVMVGVDNGLLCFGRRYFLPVYEHTLWPGTALACYFTCSTAVSCPVSTIFNPPVLL